MRAGATAGATADGTAEAGLPQQKRSLRRAAGVETRNAAVHDFDSASSAEESETLDAAAAAATLNDLFALNDQEILDKSDASSHSALGEEDVHLALASLDKPVAPLPHGGAILAGPPAAGKRPAKTLHINGARNDAVIVIDEIKGPSLAADDDEVQIRNGKHTSS